MALHLAGRGQLEALLGAAMALQLQLALGLRLSHGLSQLFVSAAAAATAGFARGAFSPLSFFSTFSGALLSAAPFSPAGFLTGFATFSFGVRICTIVMPS